MTPPSAASALRPVLQVGRNCWQITQCDCATPVVDAADYFHYARLAMKAAKQRILVIGWDFDTRIQLEPSAGKAGQSLGEFFLRLAKDDPHRRIDILKWSFGMWTRLLNPTVLWMLWRWQITRAIEFCFDSAHPPGCSHHQKILVLDDRLAFCGGIDMSSARWDTSEHLDNEPRRVMPDGKPYQPWHDVTMMLSGPVAAALGDLGEDRWYRATSRHLSPLAPATHELWPEELEVHFKDVEVGIARTQAAYGEHEEVREIEALYLDMIAAAQRFIYIENQYFTSPKVAAAIANRLQAPSPPEIILVMPRSAEGWLEQKAMDAARVQLARKIGKHDPDKRFRIYVPVTEQGRDIYVHAKVMIVDDRLLRIGSSNLNNRSLGLDSECDVIIDAALPKNHHTPAIIGRLRTRLLAEHMNVSPETFAQAFEHEGSLRAAIDAVRRPGKTLELLDLLEPSALETFIAGNELLDPENADGFFEPLSERGLSKRWRQIRNWHPWRRRPTRNKPGATP
ncbi:phospholipase [Pusillimonas sp. CC-YST705]|uniref:Phospholipase n=1 Tax=Mesopusillimonas faecipullorum TaxID=2755040 RepID=A0ABS8CA98_9BURK|nr:phospholipase D-like domain-containing protein [Mesopusillimonas faecipullorum]MCB5362962.1 phospholipase [Mesopusillimonas faecipullorum]